MFMYLFIIRINTTSSHHTVQLLSLTISSLPNLRSNIKPVLVDSFALYVQIIVNVIDFLIEWLYPDLGVFVGWY